MGIPSAAGTQDRSAADFHKLGANVFMRLQKCSFSLAAKIASRSDDEPNAAREELARLGVKVLALRSFPPKLPNTPCAMVLQSLC